MGSFDVGCGISNLAIHEGDKVGFVLIGQSKGDTEFWDQSVGTAMVTYATDLYQPMFPPVFAMYNDYGQVTDVEESTTTKLLESIFHRPTKVIINAINGGGGIYDTYGTIYESYAKEGVLIGSYTASFEEKLLSAGFTKDEDSNASAIGYHFGDFRVMHYPSSDSSLISNTKTGKILAGSISARNNDVLPTLNRFAKETGLYPGYAVEDYEAIKTLNSASGMFFLKEVYDGMEHNLLNSDRLDFYKNRYEANWNKFMERLATVENWTVNSEIRMTYGLDIIEFIRRYSVMPEFAIEKLGIYRDDSDAFFKMRYLLTIMTQVNRILMPSLCGEQHGNDEASMKLNEITGKILAARAEDY